MSAQGNFHRAQFKVYATTDAERGGLEYVEAASNRTATPDEAKAIAAQFPERFGLRAHRFIGRHGAAETGEVVFRAGLFPDKSGQGVNEGGVRRYRSFRTHAERLGHEVHYDPGHLRGSHDVISSEEDFENRLRALLLFPRGGYGVRKARLWNPQESPAWPAGHRPELFEAEVCGCSGGVSGSKYCSQASAHHN